MIALLLLAACERAAPPPEAPPAAQVAAEEHLTKAGRYRLRWRAEPTPIPLSALFEIEATVVDAATGAPLEQGGVHIDAAMPQHGHGMSTRPEDDPGTCAAGVAPPCSHPGGVYRTRGMKFHMPGEWRLRFLVEGPAGTDTLDLPVTL